MAKPGEFQSQNHAVDGIDEAAKAFFDRAQAKRKAAGVPDAEPGDRAPNTVEDPEVTDRLTRLGVEPDPEAEPKPPVAEEEPEEEPEPLAAEEAEPEPDPEPEDEPEGEDLSPDTMIRMTDGSDVSIHELQRGFLREADYTTKTMELATQRKDFETKVGEAYAVYEKRIGDANTLAQSLEAAMATYQPNQQAMEKLRVTDPGEYAARIEDLRIKQGMINQALQGRKEAEVEAGRIAEEKRAANVPVQRGLLASKNPAFKKDFEKEYEKLSRYAVASDGGELRPDEWDLVDDHRYVNLVWKAREYDRATRNTAPAVRKKIARKPRRLRSGSAQAEAGDTGDAGVKAAMANLKANPDSKKAAEAVFLAREQRRRTASGRRGRT